MQPFFIMIEELRRDRYFVLLQHLGQISGVDLYREGRTIGIQAIGFVDTETVMKHVGRVIENQYVIGHVQMAVIVAPLATNGFPPDGRKFRPVHQDFSALRARTRTSIALNASSISGKVGTPRGSRNALASSLHA